MSVLVGYIVEIRRTNAALKDPQMGQDGQGLKAVKALVTAAATSLECVSGKEYPVSSSLK